LPAARIPGRFLAPARFSCHSNSAMSNKIVAQKKRGRPPTGVDPHISIRLPEHILAALGRIAEAEELSRSEVIRVAVADYLKRKRALPRLKENLP
jgi:Ribbon-helix-helix protein, copG family